MDDRIEFRCWRCRRKLLEVWPSERGLAGSLEIRCRRCDAINRFSLDNCQTLAIGSG